MTLLNNSTTEYLIPTIYQNQGCGISVVIAGLEDNIQNYKTLKISINNIDYITTEINQENDDFSNIITFNNLDENRYYDIYGKITYVDDTINHITAKIVSQKENSSPTTTQKYRYFSGITPTHNPPMEVIL